MRHHVNRPITLSNAEGKTKLVKFKLCLFFDITMNQLDFIYKDLKKPSEWLHSQLNVERMVLKNKAGLVNFIFSLYFPNLSLDNLLK